MAVTKASAPDYNDFVPAADEMHLDRIEKKARGGKYASAADVLADLRKIVQNAAVYNAPGCGKYGGPAIVTWAESLVAAVEEQLESQELAPLLVEAEGIVKAEAEERAAAERLLQTENADMAAGTDTASAPEGEAGDGSGAMEQWVQCSKCQKWRRISNKVADETVASASDAPWFCEWDYERPNASCDLPDDYEAENENGDG